MFLHWYRNLYHVLTGKTRYHYLHPLRRLLPHSHRRLRLLLRRLELESIAMDWAKCHP